MGEIKPWQRYTAIIIIIALFINGIVLLCTCDEDYVVSTELTEYSNCTNRDGKRCADEVSSTCACSINLDLKSDLNGTVVMFYELETFTQNNGSYEKSRDNKQLAGELLPTPSDDCGEFTYDDTPKGRMPIAPCGAVADSMFTDYFSLVTKQNSFVPALYSGLLSEEDKKGFHNPPGDPLEKAFENFTKPKSWLDPVWKLGTGLNNGFENEAFIAWMRTDWKRKPIWRVDHSKPNYEAGLPKGSYVIKINYEYPSARYNGPRKLFAEHKIIMCNSTKFVIGAISLAIASLLAVLFVLFWKLNTLRSKYSEWISVK